MFATCLPPLTCIVGQLPPCKYHRCIGLVTIRHIAILPHYLGIHSITPHSPHTIQISTIVMISDPFGRHVRITSPPVLTLVAIVCDADQTSISGAVKGVLAVPKVGVSNGLREVVVTLRDVTQLPLDAFCECRVNFLIVSFFIC